MSRTLITKSLYLKGRQCAKRIWLLAQSVEEPMIEQDAVWEERAEVGAEVESYAEQLYPHGVAIRAGAEEHGSWESRRARAIEATRAALEGRAAVFQARLLVDDLYAEVDILEPRGSAWFLWEVKASTWARAPEAGSKQKLTPLHEYDLAYQVHLARAAGLEIAGAGLLMLEKTYERRVGAIDPEELIAKKDCTERVEQLQPLVAAELAEMRRVLAASEPPKENPASRCKGSRDAVGANRPSSCGHLAPDGECGRDLPEYWAGRLPRLSGTKDRFVRQNPGLSIEELNAMDKARKWSSRQQRVIHAVQQGAPVIDGAALRASLTEIEWPVTYTDFEFDPGMAVPRYPGTRPYDVLPFQWSMFVQEEPNAPLVEKPAFLHLDDSDPRLAFAESWLAALAPRGSIVAHHAQAEVGVLKQLAERLGGAVGPQLLAACQRFRDTEVISTAGYYHPDQQGSYSIKKLAPALIDRGYEDLAIGDGMVAVMDWKRAIAPETSATDREQIAEALLKYCGRDAELMHEILEELRRLVG